MLLNKALIFQIVNMVSPLIMVINDMGILRERSIKSEGILIFKRYYFEIKAFCFCYFELNVKTDSS